MVELPGGHQLTETEPEVVVELLAQAETNDRQWWNAVREYAVFQAQPMIRSGHCEDAQRWFNVVATVASLVPEDHPSPTWLTSKITLGLSMHKACSEYAIPAEELAADAFAYMRSNLANPTVDEAETIATRWAAISHIEEFSVAELRRWRSVKRLLAPFAKVAPDVIGVWAAVVEGLP